MFEGRRPYAHLVFAKTGRLRWLGQLDLSRAFERALRRSRLPVSYSQGFNPHMKLSFAHPLPVGAEGLAEICAVDLEYEVPVRDIGKKLAPELFDDLRLTEAQVLWRGRRSPFADLNMATYELYLTGEGLGWLAETGAALAALMESEELLLTRQTKSQSTELDLRPGIYSAELSVVGGDEVKLAVELALGEGHLVKPEEVVTCLARLMPEDNLALKRLVRTGLR